MSRSRRVLVGPVELPPDPPRQARPEAVYYCPNGMPSVDADIVPNSRNRGDLVIRVFNQRWRFPIWCKSGLMDGLNVLGAIITVRPDLLPALERLYRTLKSELSRHEQLDVQVVTGPEERPEPREIDNL